MDLKGGRKKQGEVGGGSGVGDGRLVADMVGWGNEILKKMVWEVEMVTTERKESLVGGAEMFGACFCIQKRL